MIPDNPTSEPKRVLFAVFLLGVIAAEVFIVQPGFVQGLVEVLSFSDTFAGYTAAAEMFGLATSAILMTFLSHRINWHKIIGVSLGATFLINVLCVLIDDASVFIFLRFLAGLGAGGLVTLSFAAVAQTANPERNYGLMIMWILLYGAAGLWIMPTIFGLGGLDPVLLFFAIFPLTLIPFIKLLPAGAAAVDEAAAAGGAGLPAPFQWSALAAILLYFTAQGVIWAYLFLIGLDGGLDEREVANALTLSQLGGVAGALLAAMIGKSVRPAAPLVAGIVGGAICLFVLVQPFGILIFASSVLLYNFAWNLTHPFLFGAMARFDPAGRLVVYAVAMQMVGLAAGPFVAATIVSAGTFTGALLLGAILLLVCLILILPPIFAHSRSARGAGLENNSHVC